MKTVLIAPGFNERHAQTRLARDDDPFRATSASHPELNEEAR